MEEVKYSTPNYVGLENRMKSKEVGKIFEINLGCFGGMDATVYKEAWDETFRKFSKGRKNVRDFFKKLDSSQPEGAKDLFEDSLQNVARSIVQAAEQKGLKEIYVVVTNETYIKNGEEDFLLAQEIARQLGKDPGEFIKTNAMTADQYVDKVETGEIDQARAFIYDDFTPNDLINYYREKYSKETSDESTKEYLAKVRAKYVESFFVTGHSLYPRDLEDPTDKDFSSKKKLNIDNPRFPLIRNPILGEDIPKERLGSINLTKKVLKNLGGSSGEGIKFYKQNVNRQNKVEVDTYFNEEDMEELIDNKDDKFVLEDFVAGPITKQPLNLVKQADGSAISEYGKIEDYAVDLRFGYEYDPITNEIKVLTSYGRFAKPGQKNNISQGGGVVEVKVVKNEDYYPLLSQMYKMTSELSAKEGKEFHDLFAKNLAKRGFLNNGSPIPFAPLPYLVSESTFNEMKDTALYLAKEMQAKKHPDQSKFIFALDAFANPQPEIFSSPTS